MIAEMREIRSTIESRIAVVTIDRVERRNALTFAMWRYLTELVASLGADASVRGIVLQGAGGHFSAGADITEFDKVRADAEQGHAYEKGVDDCADAIMAAPKPVIAAVSGYCVGGGCGIAMACDFRIAHPESVFSIPAAKLSIVYGMRETQNLLALVGLANAKRILYAGERFGADEALQMRFVDRVEDDPLAAARAFAASMADSAPLTISGSKYILTALATGQGALRPERAKQIFDAAFSSEDYREGQRAFKEKRKPVFVGK
jgi:enoyl-CoA hydratase/carnithine racemase